jgi:protein-tyrosine phosphatase
MFDLHSHLLPEIDDGAADVGTSLDMARAYVDQGVQYVACTPHILPGLYHNTGGQIRRAVALMQARLDDAGIPLRLLTGADNHMVPEFIIRLREGCLLTLADSPYVLVEPPHHVAPARLEGFFFDLLLAGYIPILTHPERLSWIENKYDVIKRLASRGVWMQITSGSIGLSGSWQMALSTSLPPTPTTPQRARQIFLRGAGKLNGVPGKKRPSSSSSPGLP